MRFKLDENIPESAKLILEAEGYDVHSVYDENLGGSPDDNIAEACRREQRVLITLDLDFADTRHFPPQEQPGLIVLRPVRQSEPRILDLIRRMTVVLTGEDIQGRLWIVQWDRIRVK